MFLNYHFILVSFYIYLIEFALNASVQKTTGKSPAEIVFEFKINRTQWHEQDKQGTFQELMNKVLQGINGKEAVVYLDDILIFSRTIEEHWDRLDNVLKRIQIAGLRINPEKCFMLKTEVKFLGHIISSKCIKNRSNENRNRSKF